MSAIVNDLAILLVFLLIGFALRELIKPLQKLFLPAGLIGGIVALLVGPQVLGWVNLPESWSGMASPMINIVLTCLMFGTALNKSKLRTYAGAVNLVILTYFAQMFFGTLTGIGLQKVWSGLPESWGIMAIFTYWGGHGAGASAGQLFEDLGADGMLSIGLILATLGLIIAMVVGIILVNIAVRKGYATNLPIGDDGKIKTICGPIPAEKQKSLGKATASSDAINGLALQLAIVLFCMWLGGKVFALVQLVIPAASNVPSLLYGIVGAFIVWPVMRKLHLDNYADKTAINNISGVALEICICSATATLNLKIFADYLVPILIHMVVIVIIMVFVCMVLTKRWLKRTGWSWHCCSSVRVPAPLPAAWLWVAASIPIPRIRAHGRASALPQACSLRYLLFWLLYCRCLPCSLHGYRWASVQLSHYCVCCSANWS